MAPQLGMGTFRIEQFGYDPSYAMSNGSDTEFWALPRPAGELELFAPTFILPIDYRFVSVDLPTFCQFLMDQGEDPNDFRIRYHYPIRDVRCEPERKRARLPRKKKRK